MATLAQSGFARTLMRCGFSARSDEIAVLVRPCRADAELPPAAGWLLTSLDGSAW
jgi:hypothetical protein